MQPDRVPIDIGGTLATTMHQSIYERLMQAVGLGNSEEGTLETALQTAIISEDLVKLLNGDIVGLYSREKDWKVLSNVQEQLYIDEWGIMYRLPSSGWYYEMIDHPLANANLASLNDYSWPNPKDSRRFSDIEKKARHYFENTSFAITAGCTFGGGVLQDGAWLVGFERWLSSFAENIVFVEEVMDRILEFHIGYWDAMLERIGKYIQVAVIGDDLGTQESLFISPRMYRSLIKPRHRKLVDTIKRKADVKVLLHSDGAIHDIIPDIIECGIDILNPVQVSAKGMEDTKKLKKEFGRDIVFWGGGCDTQKVLPFGTPKGVKQEVVRRMEDLKSDGGYIFAPVHNIQPLVPIANVLAMYEAAFEAALY
jgi:uroporphyrinogen decarboxylase